MKLFNLTIFTLTLGFCFSANAQDKPLTKQEIKVVNLIAQLPEVVESDKYMRTHGPDKRHLETYIERNPTKSDVHYYLAVAENNGVLMVSHYKFAVNSKTYAISYYDVLTDKLTPLNVWRKNGRKRM